VILELASIFQLKLQPNIGGFRGGYTLLGSSIAKLPFGNQPIMHTTRKTIMHIVKWVEACVPLAFLEFKLFHFSQQNALHSVSNYNTEITQHKYTIPIATKSSKTSN
jgi:hypothetical protein